MDVPVTSDFGAHLVSQAETPVHQRREALADDPTPAFLRDALLSHSADEICPGLYLSGLEAGLMYGEMKKHGITHILVVAASAEMRYPEDFIYKRLPVYDSKQEDLLSHFESSLAFINEGRTRGAVLVHCMAGVSRSASIVTAWLMKENQWDVTKALHKLKKKRPIVCPNENFMWQLHQWQAMGYTLEGSSLAHKQYRRWKKRTEKGRQQLRDRAAFLQSTMVKAPDAAQESSESGCTLQ